MKQNSIVFPATGAWMSAILLTLLMGVVTLIIKQTSEPLSRFIEEHLSTKMSWSLSVLSLLAPVLIIAFIHHWLHLILDRFFPDTQSATTDISGGFFPGLMSWWEGLFAWLAIAVSTILAVGIIIAVFPYDSSENSIIRYLLMLCAWDEPKHLLSAPVIGRTAIAAYIYHFEYLVRCRVQAEATSSRW